MAAAKLLIAVCLCIPICGGQTCDKPIKMPKAMDIETFNTQVANTNEDWVGLFMYLCPVSEFLSSMKQFRTLISVSEGELHRTISYRASLTAPCEVYNQTFVQVGSEWAVFRRTGPDSKIREDRYLDTGNLDDYYIKVTCRDSPEINTDNDNNKRDECSSYFVVVMIRNDPPSQFPWTQALDDMKKFAPIEDDEIYSFIMWVTYVQLCDLHGGRTEMDSDQDSVIA